MVFVYQYQFTLIFCFFGHVIGKKKCMNKMRHSYS